MILFENDSAVVADKPHGWLTTPAREANDPRKVLGLEVQKLLGRRIWPVHRLDYEVSGLVLFAKSAEAHKVFNGWFENGEIQKTYTAFSERGGLPGEWMDWKSMLVRGKRRTFEAPHGKEAHTRARVKGIDGKIRVWELMPLTGRAHQLRFEMAKHESPILGDILYGGSVWRETNEIALRAVKLDLSAVSGERFDLPETLVAPPLK